MTKLTISMGIEGKREHGSRNMDMKKEIRDMSFKLEKLLIWQNAMDFGEEINGLTSVLPEKEKFNLSSQRLRAVDSVALNISEGSICQSNPEFRKFLGFSIRAH